MLTDFPCACGHGLAHHIAGGVALPVQHLEDRRYRKLSYLLIEPENVGIHDRLCRCDDV